MLSNLKNVQGSAYMYLNLSEGILYIKPFSLKQATIPSLSNVMNQG